VVALAVILIALSEFLISARDVTEIEPSAGSASVPPSKLEGDEPEPEPTPQVAVSERVARAILLSGQPPLPPEPPKAEPSTPSEPERRPRLGAS
jgi:hypothetical protein